MNIGSSLGRNARLFPDKLAIIFQDKTYTYDQLNRAVNSLAHGLISLGIKKGDKVCLMMKNSDYFPISFFAASKIGAVTVPINIRFTKSEVAYIVEHSDAKAIIFDEEFGELIEQARSPMVEYCIAVHDVNVEGHLSYNRVLSQKETNPDVVVELVDDSHILYTSGTTGKPKGALFDHYSGIMFIFNALGETGFKKNVLHFMPFFHSAGFCTIFKDLFMGATIVIQSSFEPIEVFKAIEKYKIDSILAVPTMYNMMLQIPNKEQYDLSSVQSLLYGGAPMSSDLIKRCMGLFNTDQFYNRCGLTEAGPGGITLYPDDHKGKLGASGKPRFLFEARVVNDEGQDVAVGETGELILKSELVMKEYYKNPIATEEAIRDGWLYTGDMCTIDEERFITIVDRKKDMIISGGKNVYSVEVENILDAFEGVLEVAVIGLPDEKWGELVTAVIVPQSGYEIDNDQLVQFCREHLAGYKIPRQVYHVNELPRNASGKILKYVLRNKYFKDQSNLNQYT